MGTDSTGLPAETNIALICLSPGGVVISLAISAAGSMATAMGIPPTRDRLRYDRRIARPIIVACQRPPEGLHRTEHRPAGGDIEVARDEIHRVDQVCGEGAVPPDARAEPAVDGRPRLAHQIPRQRPDTVRIDARLGSRELGGGEPRRQRLQPFDTVGERLHLRGVDQTFGEHHLQQRQQQVGVGVGHDGKPLERRRRLGAARIDDDHPPAPRLTMSCMRSLIRGAVRKLPCETTGFAPIMTSRSVRVRSGGIGTEVGAPPYSIWLAISLLLVSCDDAVK